MMVLIACIVFITLIVLSCSLIFYVCILIEERIIEKLTGKGAIESIKDYIYELIKDMKNSDAE